MNIVNLANVHKLLKEFQQSESVLSSVDWSTCSLEYKIAASAITGNVDEVCKLMHRIGNQGDIGIQEYREWPAFFGVRDDLKFKETFEVIFGIPYAPEAKKHVGISQVIDYARRDRTVPSPEEIEIVGEEDISLQPTDRI